MSVRRIEDMNGRTALVRPATQLHGQLRAGWLTHVLPLSVALGTATFLRVVDLNGLGYNSDEAVYAGQAAAIAQLPILSDIFPVFRAHPLLFQYMLAVVYKFTDGDLAGRLLSASFGVATVLLVYLIGVRLYGRWAGLVAAILLAVMPYHVVPTRQVLLDGPMVFFATLTLYAIVRLGETHRMAWLYAAGASMGLTVLAKETGIILVGSIYGFLALAPEIRVRIRDIVLSLVIMFGVISAYPLSVSLAGGGGGGKTQDYLIWQLFRRPNHTWDFYFRVVPPAIGLFVIVAALLGLWLLRRRNDWPEKLLVFWILVPLVFFELWPTKGFQYLLPIAAPFALLAARTLTLWPAESAVVEHRPRLQLGLAVLLAVAVIASVVPTTWARIHPDQSSTFLAGSGGVPGGREVGEWIAEHTPDGATFMTIGPSMANIVKYYGHREAYGASVSPNPLHRNPSYEPVINPDYQIRTSELQYLVWDSFSAERSTFFSDKVLYYVEKYNGRVLHTETVELTTPEGEKVEKPVIIVYEVYPSW